jgi:hypothetical protein
MPDILIPLGAASQFRNQELRFCLRSIEQYATGYDRVFIIGENPGFLSNKVCFVPVRDAGGNKEIRIANKVRRAFQATDISDEVAFWNDDYVLTAPIDLSKLESYHNESLEERAANHGGQFYRRSLEATAEQLKRHGLPTWNYDIHVPIIYRKEQFLSLASWWRHSSGLSCGLVVKSVYANNTLREPGPYMEDCKLGRVTDVDAEVKGRWIFSYTDPAFSSGLRPWLRERFPSKSTYEMVN